MGRHRSSSSMIRGVSQSLGSRQVLMRPLMRPDDDPLASEKSVKATINRLRMGCMASPMVSRAWMGPGGVHWVMVWFMAGPFVIFWYRFLIVF